MKKPLWIIGIDEVGRGPLAGPVTVCAVAMHQSQYEKVSSRSAAMIDKKGIAVCIRECIASNLKKIAIDPNDCLVLLDGGLHAPLSYYAQKTIIRGDSSEKIISLASVIAKVSRDRHMDKLHASFSSYNWNKNKGYGTKKHILALKNNGISRLHRSSFLSRILDKNQ
jgi:ribonuclease HII